MVDGIHDFPRPHERRIQVVRVDDVEPGDVLFRLDERPVGHDRTAIARSQDGRRVRTIERATEDERAGRLHLVFQGHDPLHEGLHVLGRWGRSGALTLNGVGGQQVLTHADSSHRRGPFPLSPC